MDDSQKEVITKDMGYGIFILQGSSEISCHGSKDLELRPSRVFVGSGVTVNNAESLLGRSWLYC